MVTYQKQFDPEFPEDPVLCECCEYPAPVHEFDIGLPVRKAQLCEICSGTHLSIAVTYPDQCPDDRIYKALGYIGNMILEAVARNPKEKRRG